MDCPNDLKIMNTYRKLKFLYPIYTSQSTQQIFDSTKRIKTCDSIGRVIVAVIDERKKYNGFRYAQLNRCLLLKANNDYNEELEQKAPRYRLFDEHHQPFKINSQEEL